MGCNSQVDNAGLLMKNLLVITLLLITAGGAPARDGDPQPPKPTAHTKREVEGWTVHVDDRLLAGPDEALGRLALGLLEGQLRNIVLIVPEDKVQRLRRVPIWLDRTHGKLTAGQYHPSADWLAEHGYSRSLAKCVHFPDARRFTDARFQRSQPWAVLHELAHAYHDQVLGFDHAEIKAAWRKFVDGGRYKSVLHVSGKQRPHYALTNQMEFFAEMTEAYFGQNDFFPFNSGELQREEPELFKLLGTLWGPLP
jgi:hypothetical protein